MAFVTLTDARRSLAEKLGGYRLFTSGIQGDPPDGPYIGTANGSDKRRQVVSTDLVTLDVSGTGTPVATDRWKHAALYVPDVPIQRQVAEKGFSAAKLASDYTDQTTLTTTYVGLLTLAEQLGAALAPDIECELHSVMPPIAREQGMGLHACINRALEAMSIRDRIAVTTISGAGRYTLAAYPWLTDEDQLIGVTDSETMTAVDGSPLFRGGAVRFDAETPYLLINAAPASTLFYIDVWRPRSSWVRVGGTWTASTAGLVNETDAVSVNPAWLTFLSYVYACEALKNAWRGDPAGNHWANEYAQKSPTAEARLRRERTLDQPLPRMGRTDTVLRDTVNSRWYWP